MRRCSLLRGSIDRSRGGSRSGSGLNSVQRRIDERSSPSFHALVAKKCRDENERTSGEEVPAIPTSNIFLAIYFHVDVGTEMESEPRMTPVVVTLNQLERVRSREEEMAGRESWVASWIFSQSNVNSTKTEITGLEGHYNPAATTDVSSNLTTRFLFPSPLSLPVLAVKRIVQLPCYSLV